MEGELLRRGGVGGRRPEVGSNYRGREDEAEELRRGECAQMFVEWVA